MAPVQLVRAVRADQQHLRGPDGPGQEGDQVPGRPVGPVQVLDHQHQRAFGGEPGEEAGDQLEQVTPVWIQGQLGAAVSAQAGPDVAGPRRPGGEPAQLGQEPGELPFVPVERRRAVPAQYLTQYGGERRERQPLLAELQALADEDLIAPGDRVPAELLDQPGLAYPGLAADQQRRRLVGTDPLQRVAQDGEFGLTADEGGAGGASGHRFENATPLGLIEYPSPLVGTITGPGPGSRDGVGHLRTGARNGADHLCAGSRDAAESSGWPPADLARFRPKRRTERANRAASASASSSSMWVRCRLSRKCASVLNIAELHFGSLLFADVHTSPEGTVTALVHRLMSDRAASLLPGRHGYFRP